MSAPAIYDLGSIPVSKSRTLISVRRRLCTWVAVTDANRNSSFSVCCVYLCCAEVNRARSNLLGEVRQSKAEQGRARQGKARQSKARQGRARQSKSRFSKGSFKGRSPPSIPLGSHRESELVRLIRSCVEKRIKKKKKAFLREMPRASSHDLSYGARVYRAAISANSFDRRANK